MRILINIPNLKLLGGVSNHYLGLKDYWSLNVKYNVVGRRSYKKKSGLYWFPFDIVKFCWRLLFFSPDLVLLNPSLATSAVKRDMIFLSIAKSLNKKVIIFFHGFNSNSIKEIDSDKLVRNLNKCCCVLVLANQFKTELINWGITVPIKITTTKVDDKLIKDFDIKMRKNKVHNILFLSRIVKAKGVFIALDCFSLLKKRYPYLTLSVVGDGISLEEAKLYCTNNNIESVIFKGELNGRELVSEFEDGDIYLFPSSHYEGMPTSVLEAMAFGLPIITTPVGGLPDFFKDGEMGCIVNSSDPMDFKLAIEKYILAPELIKGTSFFNYEYAKNNFLASLVAKKMERIFMDCI